MRIILYFLFVLFLLTSCGDSQTDELSDQRSIDLSVLKPFLLGEDLSETFEKKEDEFSFYGKQTIKKEAIKETFIYINSKETDVFFKQLSKWFDNQFKASQLNEQFNSWHNDTNEYLLYKQGDSTIFVNIYKKTYK